MTIAEFWQFIGILLALLVVGAVASCGMERFRAWWGP